jgi:hypothetical protein
VPTEQLADAVPVWDLILNPFASEADRAEWMRRREAGRAEIERRQAERKAANAALMARLREVCSTAALVVVELHAPTDDGDRCEGCDVAGYEAEQPDWPCRTAEAIAAHYGINLEAP